MTLVAGLAVASASVSAQLASRTSPASTGIASADIAGTPAVEVGNDPAPIEFEPVDVSNFGDVTEAPGDAGANEKERMTFLEALQRVAPAMVDKVGLPGQNNAERAVVTTDCTSLVGAATGLECQTEGNVNGTTMDVAGNAENVSVLEEANGSGMATWTGGCTQTLIVDFGTGGFPPCTTGNPTVLTQVNLRLAYYLDVAGLPDTSQPLFDDAGNAAIYADDTSAFPGTQNFATRLTQPNGTSLGFAGAVEYYYTHSPISIGTGSFNDTIYGMFTGTWGGDGIPGTGDEAEGSCFWIEWFEAGDLSGGTNVTCRVFQIWGNNVDIYSAVDSAPTGVYGPGDLQANDWTYCIDAPIDLFNLGFNASFCKQPPVVPDNDNCGDVEADPTSIGAGGFTFTPADFGVDFDLGSNGGAGTVGSLGDDEGARSCNGTAGNLNGGIWYKFTGNGNDFLVSLCRGVNPPDGDVEISIYCGGCDCLYCVAGNQDAVGTCPEVEFCTEPGVEYLIFVANQTGFGAASMGDIRVEDLGTPCTPDLPRCQPCDFGDVCTNGLDLDGDTVAEIPNVNENLVEPCMTGTIPVGNQGCNSDGSAAEFIDLVCGDVICGTLNNDDAGGRNHDWYKLTLASDSIVTWEAAAELGFNLIIGTAPSDGMGGFNCGGVTNFTTIATGGAERCFFLGQAQAGLAAGEWILFIGVDPFFNYPCEKDENDYLARVTCKDAQDPCPPGGISEGSTCPDDPGNPNNGCNSFPVRYTTANCGETWCGLARADSGTRDLDWYEITLAQPTNLKVELFSEFDGAVTIVDANPINCNALDIISSTTGAPCDTISATACVPAGTYVIIVSPATFSNNFPCQGAPFVGNRYTVDFICDPVCDLSACPPGAVVEMEACGSDSNGGCNDDPPAFEDLGSAPVVVCGTYGTDDVNGIRDTDWYTVTCDSDGDLSVTITAESHANLTIAQLAPDCDNLTVLAQATSIDPCAPFKLAAAGVTAGQYVVIVSSDDFGGDGDLAGGMCKNYQLDISCGSDTVPCCVLFECFDVSQEDCDNMCGIAPTTAGSDCSTSTCPCPADFATTGQPNPGFPQPDGNVDLADLLAYVNVWNSNQGMNPANCFADTTTTGSGNSQSAGCGSPDANGDLSDLLFFVNVWNASLGTPSVMCPNPCVDP